MSSQAVSRRIAGIAAILLASLTLGGLLLRLFWLARRALHNDEALQLNGIQTTTWKALVEHCARVDFHPPASYLIQRLFYQHVDSSAWGLRLPSVLLGTASIPLTYWALRPLTGRLAALAAAALTAVSYPLIWFSRELRDYSLFYFLTVLSLGCFLRAIPPRTGGGRAPWFWLAGFVAATAISAYSDFFTYLLWPVFAGMLLVSEWRRGGWRGIRWPVVFRFAAAGLVAAVAAIPTFRWFLIVCSMVETSVSYRPPLDVLAGALAPFGFGNGWREVVWGAGMAAGLALLLARRRRAGWLLSVWVFGYLLGYVYVVGMPAKFFNAMCRYALPLALGATAVLGTVAAAVSWSVLPRRALAGKALLACVIPVAAVALLMGGDFRVYYGLRASGLLYGDLAATLAARPATSVLLDNYYEFQYLRHHLPTNVTLAAPPLFNNPAEYAQAGVAAYVRRSIETHPLLAFYDSTTGRSHAGSGTDWSWLDAHFCRRFTLANRLGAQLERRRLNLFVLPSNLAPILPTLYWNAVEDLPAWYARRGVVQAAALGPEWFLIPCMAGNGIREPVPVLGRPGTVFLYNGWPSNATARLRLALVACAPEQRLLVSFNGGGEGIIGPFGEPMTVASLTDGSVQTGYVPLAELARQHSGLPQIPLAYSFVAAITELDVRNWPPGISTLRIVPEKPDGVALLDVAFLDPGQGR